MKTIIANLKSSPMFNLSLSSKELFHSNFIAWVAENSTTSGAFARELLNFLNINNSTSIKSVKREKSFIDIQIEFSNGLTILIENKVKSMPSKLQLEKYSTVAKKINNCRCILLSLSQPSFFQGQTYSIHGITWIYMSYSDLLTMFLSIQQKITPNCYVYQILNDYCFFIKNLVSLNKKITTSFSSTHFSTQHDKIWKDLNSIRIGDFYEKRRYELLVYDVFRAFGKNGANVFVGKEPLKIKPIKVGEIYINSGFYNSCGLVELKYIKQISPIIILGIQVQNGQYRRFIEFDSPNQAIPSRYSNWLSTCSLPLSKNQFNQFTNKFKYRYNPYPCINLQQFITDINQDISIIKTL